MPTKWKKGPTPGFYSGGMARGGDIPFLSPELSGRQSACFLRQVYSCNSAPTVHSPLKQKSMVTECQRSAVSLSNKNACIVVPFTSVAKIDFSDVAAIGMGEFSAKKNARSSRFIETPTSWSLLMGRSDVVSFILQTKSIVAAFAGDAANRPRKNKARILHLQVELCRKMTQCVRKAISFISPEVSGPALTPCKRGPRLKANSPARSLGGGFYGRSPARPRAIRGRGEYRPHTAKIGGCHG